MCLYIMSKLNKKKLKLENKLYFQAKKLKQKKTSLKSNEKKKTKRDKNMVELTEDDHTIHTMERLMNIGTSRKRKLPSSFAQDGLDYILDVVDQSDDIQVDTAPKAENQLSDLEDDSDDNCEQLVDTSGDESSNFNSEYGDTSKDNIIMDVHDDTYMDNIAKSRSTDSDDEKLTFVQTSDDKATLTESHVITKYVPPAYRATDEGEQKKIEKIKRQLKGLINRVSESNLQSICFELESFYKTNSRAVITQTLSDVILIQFYTPDPIPERLITESAMVIAILCHNIGNEVVAYFLEAAAKKLQELLMEDNCGRGK